MSKPKWHKGAPPSIGWWPACIGSVTDRSTRLIRWWNGRVWSIAAMPTFTAVEAADCAKFEALHQDFIRWTDRWWL